VSRLVVGGGGVLRVVQEEEEQSLAMGEQEVWWGVNTLSLCIAIMAVLMIAFG
jgi:hypothetical protein